MLYLFTFGPFSACLHFRRCSLSWCDSSVVFKATDLWSSCVNALLCTFNSHPILICLTSFISATLSFSRKTGFTCWTVDASSSKRYFCFRRLWSPETSLLLLHRFASQIIPITNGRTFWALLVVWQKKKKIPPNLSQTERPLETYEILK